MKIGPDEVRHVARLAEMALPEADVAPLAEQLARIVTFVDQLAEVPIPAGETHVVVGPDQTPLRDDVVDPIPMTRRPEEMAPAFEQGFFIVPKLGGLAGE